MCREVGSLKEEGSGISGRGAPDRIGQMMPPRKGEVMEEKNSSVWFWLFLAFIIFVLYCISMQRPYCQTLDRMSIHESVQHNSTSIRRPSGPEAISGYGLHACDPLGYSTHALADNTTPKLPGHGTGDCQLTLARSPENHTRIRRVTSFKPVRYAVKSAAAKAS
jgi:hypothetical protein